MTTIPNARDRMAEIEARARHGMAEDAMVLMREHVPWLLEQLRSAQAETERLTQLLTLDDDDAMTTTGEFGGICIVKRDVWDKFEQRRVRLRAAVDAARKCTSPTVLFCEGNAFIPSNDVWGLINAIAAIDAAEGKRGT